MGASIASRLCLASALALLAACGGGSTGGGGAGGEGGLLEGITDAHNAVRAATGDGIAPLTWDTDIAQQGGRAALDIEAHHVPPRAFVRQGLGGVAESRPPHVGRAVLL